MTTTVNFPHRLCVQKSPLTLFQDFLRAQDDGEALICNMDTSVAENK